MKGRGSGRRETKLISSQEAVFDIQYFRQNPEPFYTLAHELYPGKYRPTITHSFIRLLHDKGLLLKHFTQNIDCLDRAAGVPDDKIVEAHGSFARQSCIDCHEPYPEDDIKAHIDAMTIPHCERCGGLVKPEIVFFGEALPADFFANRMLPSQADLCIVMGTSLTVQPFANLPSMTREQTPRVLINKERVGGIGSGADDVLLIGDCDDGVRELAGACGWGEELERLWAGTKLEGEGGERGEKAEKTKGEKGEEKVEKTKDEALEEEIEKLTKGVDETLNLSKWHQERVRDERLPHGSRPEKGASNGTRAKDGESAGNLSHVFVSDAQEAASSITPVIPQQGDDTPAETTDGKDADGDGGT